MVDFFVNIFVGLIQSLNGITHNYGLSMVLLGFGVRIALWNLTNTQYKSMADMQKMQPLLEGLKEKYAHDQEKLTQETMRIYSENGVNPMAGCLPMLVQMPIMLGIIQAVWASPELFANAYFLWVHPGFLQAKFPDLFASNLSEPDILILMVYIGMMFVSQSFSASNIQGPQAQLMKLLPLGIALMMWMGKFPTALFIYWASFTFFGLIQQYRFARVKDVKN